MNTLAGLIVIENNLRIWKWIVERTLVKIELLSLYITQVDLFVTIFCNCKWPFCIWERIFERINNFIHQTFFILN